jgi:hypothetical protein
MSKVEITRSWEVEMFIVEVEGNDYVVKVDGDDVDITSMLSFEELREEDPLFQQICDEVVG